jgi:hypothetical protein
MSLQYLEALKALGAAPSTKLVVPAEFTSLLRPLIEHTGEAQRVPAVTSASTRVASDLDAATQGVEDVSANGAASTASGSTNIGG